MIGTLTRALRWLWNGSPRQSRQPARPWLCEFCLGGHHIHDMNTGTCVTTWCECGGRR